MIAQALDPPDLLAFRRSSKAFERLSHDTFVRRHFVRRKHVWTAHSLQVLLDVLQDPDFGKHVREITLVAVSPTPPMEWHKQVSEFIRINQNQQTALRALRLDRILRYLDNAKVNVSWKLSTEVTDIPCFGPDQICREYEEMMHGEYSGYFPVLLNPCKDGDVFAREFLSVLAASQYPIQALSLSILELCKQAFQLPPTILEEIRRGFRALHRLEIVALDLDDLCESLTIDGVHLEDMLSEAHVLKEVKLDAVTRHVYNLETFFDIVGDLESLELCNIDLSKVDHDVIQHCLGKSRLKLERLTIHNVVLGDGVHWAFLAGYMLEQMPALNYLRLSTLTCDLEHRRVVALPDRGWIKEEYCGREAVLEPLKKLRDQVIERYEDDDTELEFPDSDESDEET